MEALHFRIRAASPSPLPLVEAVSSEDPFFSFSTEEVADITTVHVARQKQQADLLAETATELGLVVQKYRMHQIRKYAALKKLPPRSPAP